MRGGDGNFVKLPVYVARRVKIGSRKIADN